MNNVANLGLTVFYIISKVKMQHNFTAAIN
jgi:hypothetical protein